MNLRRETAAQRHRHLAMMAVERPKMKLRGVLHELRAYQQSLGVRLGPEVLYHGEVRVVVGEHDEPAGGSVIAVSDLVGFLRRLRTGVAVNLERDGDVTDF